jgi:tRNA uridine 5-carbamoylmethylation protein Kti12
MELVLTVGLPGSGKSTWAAQWLAEDPDNRRRIERDEVRIMLGGLRDFTHEAAVTRICVETLRDHLLAGLSVVVSDTNLPASSRSTLTKIAVELKVPYTYKSFLHVPVETCIKRDLLRVDPVTAEIIIGMRERYRNLFEKDNVA